MERIKNKLFYKRRVQAQENEEMETEDVVDTTSSSGRPAAAPSLLNVIPHVPSFLSRSRSSDPVVASRSSEGGEKSNDHNSVQLTNGSLSLKHSELSSKIDLLSAENLSLQDLVKDLKDQLNSLKETQEDLESKNEDLTQSLQLEKRRFLWQKTFYEKKILDLAMATSSYRSNNGHTSNLAEDDVKELLKGDLFYHETILELVTEQENKSSELAEIKSAFESEIKRLTAKHEETIAELIECNHEQVKLLVQNHEDLVKDLLTGCEGMFDEMKVEYLRDAESNVELKTKSGGSIWAQFQGLSSEKKGIVVAGVCIVTVATAGWASWGFIIWVWPRLIMFAEFVAANPELLAGWLPFLISFLNSSQFQSFVKSWEEGKPLGTCLKSVVNSDMLSSALQLAPNLFTQLKNRKKNNSVQITVAN